MIGLGTMINVGCIIAGGILGMLFGSRLSERYQETLTQATGVSTMFMGIAGVMENMLKIEDNSLSSSGTLMMVICFAIGSLLGEWMNIEARIEQFGEWLKQKTGNSSDKGFVNAFVTASLTVCIGAMAVVGSIQDGIYGNYNTLAIKGILDLLIICVMTVPLGKGCMFSAIPVALFQGTITILAGFLEPVMTDTAVSYLSLTGNVLIFCVGVNLVWNKKFKVANMLPTIVIAVLWAVIENMM